MRVRLDLMRQARRIVRQVGDAGYRLPPGDIWPQRFRIDPATQTVIFANVEPLHETTGIDRRKRQAVS